MNTTEPASATIHDVARRAGVSIMTVSRAFSAPDLVAAKTLQRVEEAAAAIGYVPHRLAGALRSGVSNLVAAIVPSLENSLFAEFLQGLADGLAPEGMLLTAGDGRHHAANEERLIAEYLGLSPRALVLHETIHAPATAERLKRLPVPVIEVGDMVAEPIQHNISYSNRAAAKGLARHLIERGRRRIAFISLPEERSARTAPRRLGYADALEEAGLPVDPTLLVASESGFETSAKAARQAILDDPSIDSIIGGGDVFAIGAMFACQRLGRAVPDDIAIASFDDHPICREFTPALTALSIPRREIGLATARLIARIGREGGGIDPVRQDLGFTLVARAST